MTILVPPTSLREQVADTLSSLQAPSIVQQERGNHLRENTNDRSDLSGDH